MKHKTIEEDYVEWKTGDYTCIFARIPRENIGMHIYAIYYEDKDGKYRDTTIRAKSFAAAWDKARDRYGSGVHQIRQLCSCGGEERRNEKR